MLNYPVLYPEHLSDHDLGHLSRVAGWRGPAARFRAQLAGEPGMIDDLLADPRLFDAIFAAPDPGFGPPVTPFLAFGILVHRSARELRAADHVPEWVEPGRRLPVFDVAPLREFVDDGARRYFLIELLASFTKVAGGSTLVKTRRGYRRRRYSELDPVGLVELVEQLPPVQRPAGYRRLGDGALFLSGVFPDHTARRPLGSTELRHLVDSAGIPPGFGDDRRLDLYEAAGAAWYRKAVDAAEALVGSGPEPLRDVADRFRPARRFLNYLTDRYLFRLDTGLAGPHL